MLVAFLPAGAVDTHLVQAVDTHLARAVDTHLAAVDTHPAGAVDTHLAEAVDTHLAGAADLVGIGPVVGTGSVRFAGFAKRPASRNRSRARACKARRT